MLMKRVVIFMLLFVLTSMYSLAQTIEATSDDIADAFDLSAAIELFGRSRTIEDFEEKLNDQTIAISNLDLNGDGEVDYLRCVEDVDHKAHYVLIQACIGPDLYQDIATIYVKKDKKKVSVQIIGNDFFYGDNYIIEPTYIVRPIIIDWFWHPNYCVWHSPYYYGYYPVYYHHHCCIHYSAYHAHIHAYHHTHYCCYHHTHHFYGHHSHCWQHNHYAASHPNHAFNNRYAGTRNVRNYSDARRPSYTMHSSRGEVRPAATSRSSSNGQYTPSRSSSNVGVRTSGSPRSATYNGPSRSSSSSRTATYSGPSRSTSGPSYNSRSMSTSSSSSRSASYSTPSRSSSSSFNRSSSMGSSRSSVSSSPSRSSMSTGGASRSSMGSSRSSSGSHGGGRR